MSYFGQIRRGIRTSWKGLSLTWKHLWSARRSLGSINVDDPAYFTFSGGHVTLQYPHEMISIPDHGRNQLDCEIDDCIVCDKCAKICPVNCIDIEAIKSPELIRYTSDGSPVRLHAAKFDIDLAKCCFCGLCTTVCPTECLTMNNEFDYSVLDIRDLNFAFSNLSPAEVQEKQALYDQFVAEKAAIKEKSTEEAVAKPAAEARPRPAFKPKAKPEGLPEVQGDDLKAPSATSKVTPQEEAATPPPSVETTPAAARPKPLFRPKAKPSTEDVPSLAAEVKEESAPIEATEVKEDPVKVAEPDVSVSEAAPSAAPPKRPFTPKMKPKS